MDQTKTGKFIATCRKEKNLTQAQLAEIMGVSDRAVSKWETGRSMPDTSLMLELCETLGINVNELLTGERIPMENYQKEAEENLVALQEKKEKAIKDFKKIEKALIVISLLFMPIHLAINYYYPENTGTGIGELIIFIELVLLIFFFFTHYEIKLK